MQTWHLPLLRDLSKRIGHADAPKLATPESYSRNALRFSILKGAGISLAVYEEMSRDFRNLINRQPNNDELGQHAELDTEALAAKAVHDLDLCNDDQKALYAAITAALDNKDGSTAKVFFIDGPGGTDKSFLYNTLIAHIRGRREKEMIVVASVMFYVPE
ncbi:hypothetical protein BGZ54_006251, partial [Gamsiella multidivaricata]